MGSEPAGGAALDLNVVLSILLNQGYGVVFEA